MKILEQKTITPAMAVALLKKENVTVNYKEAAAIIQLLTLIVEIQLGEGLGK